MNRDELLAIPEQIRSLLKLRYAPITDFDNVTDTELEAAARYLHAASYSALEGARKLERVRAHRPQHEEEPK